MRAVVISAPGRAGVDDVPEPTAGPGEIVVEVHRVGICGTDLELFRGDMPYLATGRAWYPLRPGHEWSGVVRTVGPEVDDAWLGTRVTGDTMLGCGSCERCLDGRRNLCPNLVEVGISLGFAGALAEKLVVPLDSLHRLPETVDDEAGALVEPGGNAWRAAAAADAGPGTSVLVFGAGTIGLLAAAFARAMGADVRLVARRPDRRELAARFGIEAVPAHDELRDAEFDAVIDATDDPTIAALSVDLVAPGGRVVYIGLAGEPSTIDTRRLVLKEAAAAGILSGSAGLEPAIQGYAGGMVDPRPLIAATLPLEQAPDVLAGWRPVGVAGAPKILFDPRAR
jgi:2-desacetyl-2-hydroxyethyl bacteriochlorophyllide A dehydrogenase